MEIRRLDTIEDLFAVADGDFLVRNEMRPGSRGRGWAAEEAIAFGGWEEKPDQVHWLTVLGTPDASAEMLRFVLEDLSQPPVGVSVPRGIPLDGITLAGREDWDFMVWEASMHGGAVPVQPGEERIEALFPSPEVDAEIAAFLTAANPHHSAKPGWDAIEVWAGIRDTEGGELLACGAFCRPTPANGYLASIATAPAARGQGLGGAVTAWLTRYGIHAGDPYCSLGHYVPNEPARRLYRRLGYRTTHRMSSGKLTFSD